MNKKPSKKPAWVVDKEKAKKAASAETVWLFGLHAVRDALLNPKREKLQLVVTLNAQNKLEEAITAGDTQVTQALAALGLIPTISSASFLEILSPRNSGSRRASWSSATKCASPAPVNPAMSMS